MLILKPPDILGSEITNQGLWLTRRRFLGVLAGSPFLAVGDARPGQGGSQAPRPGREWENPKDRLTPYADITSYNNYFEFGTRKTDPAERARSFKTSPWSIGIHGECEAPGEIGIEDILKTFVQEERIYRLRCVEGWAMVVPWVGFPLAALLRRFKPTSEAKYVSFTTLHDPERMPGQRIAVLDWPYREALRIDEAMHPLALLATGLYGNSLPNQNGAPLRLVIPWKYGFKSIKAIVAIGFARERPATSWSSLAPREYGFYANVNPAVDHPRWSQRYHRNIGEGLFAEKRKTELFNGYAEQVASLYAGMDLREHF